MEILTNFFSPHNIDIFIRVLLAAGLGMVLGIQRVLAKKSAGMRTFTLVAMGSALYTVISVEVTREFVGVTMFDPLRVASQVVVGLGFLGAGVIFLQGKDRISGLTTAAGIWVSGAIGIASGFALYELAIFVTVLTFLIFSIMSFVEHRIKVASGVWKEEGTD